MRSPARERESGRIELRNVEDKAENANNERTITFCIRDDAIAHPPKNIVESKQNPNISFAKCSSFSISMRASRAEYVPYKLNRFDSRPGITSPLSVVPRSTGGRLRRAPGRLAVVLLEAKRPRLLSPRHNRAADDSHCEGVSLRRHLDLENHHSKSSAQFSILNSIFGWGDHITQHFPTCTTLTTRTGTQIHYTMHASDRLQSESSQSEEITEHLTFSFRADAAVVVGGGSVQHEVRRLEALLFRFEFRKGSSAVTSTGPNG